jgi:hypothetical protein
MHRSESRELNRCRSGPDGAETAYIVPFQRARKQVEVGVVSWLS